jgi:hypothetical protein
VLLPHPGKIVRKKNFDGEWASMDVEFVQELKNSIENLLGPKALIPKRVNGLAITSAELRCYLALYFESFISDNLPEPRSLGASMVDLQMIIIVDRCVETYQIIRDEYRKEYSEDNLDGFHKIAKETALKLFDEERKMGTAEQHEKFRDKLIQMIEKYYVNWKQVTETYLKKLKEIEAVEGKNSEKAAAIEMEYTENLRDTEQTSTSAWDCQSKERKPSSTLDL